MENNELVHYGILGMKWGVRRTPEQLARARGSSKKTDSQSTKKKTSSKTAKKSSSKSTEAEKKKTTSEMTDEELRAKINRLELEKRYKDLAKTVSPPKSTKGKDFVLRVIERSGENIATQLTTDLMGKAVNKYIGPIFNDPNLVNPKKGQKDK